MCSFFPSHPHCHAGDVSVRQCPIREIAMVPVHCQLQRILHALSNLSGGRFQVSFGLITVQPLLIPSQMGKPTMETNRMGAATFWGCPAPVRTAETQEPFRG